MMNMICIGDGPYLSIYGLKLTIRYGEDHVSRSTTAAIQAVVGMVHDQTIPTLGTLCIFYRKMQVDFMVLSNYTIHRSIVH